MKDKYVTATIRVGIESENKVGFFGGEKEITYIGQCAIGTLSDNINTTCNDMCEDGYDVISILPITRGSYGGIGDSRYGFSVTDGVIITAKLIA